MIRTRMFLAAALWYCTTAAAQPAPAEAPLAMATDALGKLQRLLPPLPPIPPFSEAMNDGVRLKDLKSKEVSIELSASKMTDVYIESTSRPLEIKVWDQPKVKVVTTIYFEGDANKLSDEEWFEKLNISVKATNGSVRIKSGTVGSGSYSFNGNNYAWSSAGADGIAIFNGEGDNIKTKSNVKRWITVYMPKDNKLDIENKYADITITANINKLHLDITNGNVEMQDANTLLLRSKYSNVNMGNVKLAEVDFINGRFTAKDLQELDMDTKYSTVEIATLKKATLRSTNDEYEIEEVGQLQGRKNYGNLRITKLTNSIELDGTNADVKVRNIAPSVDVIKIDNKYADLRLPLRNLKNYSINYIGPWSTVYGNFDKKPLKADVKTTSVERSLSDDMRELKKVVVTIDKDNDSNFSASAGDGKGTKIDIKCQNCTVDFK